MLTGANPQAALEAQMDENAAMIHITAAITLRRANVFIFGTANTATDSYTITLPPVAEAIGQFVYVFGTIANSKVITIADNNDDAAMSDLTVDTDGDDVMIMSTGKHWIAVYNSIA